MDPRPTSPEPPSIPPAPAKRRGRRWLRFAVGIVVVLALLVVAAPHAIGLDAVRTRIEASLSRELGAPCHIAGLGFSWFSGIAVQGLEIGNPSGFPAERPCLRLRRLFPPRLDLSIFLTAAHGFSTRCLNRFGSATYVS